MHLVLWTTSGACGTIGATRLPPLAAAIIFALLHCSFVVGQLPEAEVAALLALYNATDGPAWSSRFPQYIRWLQGDPCANYWYGVGCSRTTPPAVTYVAL